jgi:hypothetical protein
MSLAMILASAMGLLALAALAVLIGHAPGARFAADQSEQHGQCRNGRT